MIIIITIITYTIILLMFCVLKLVLKLKKDDKRLTSP